MQSVIWTFETATGAVRLHVGAIHRTAEIPDPLLAADRLIELFKESPAARHRFLSDTTLRSARAYVNDLLLSLDEQGAAYGNQLATLLGISPHELANVIQES